MKLTNREKTLLGIMVGMALIGGSYFGLISPQFKAYEALKTEHDAAKVKCDGFKSSLLPTNRIYNDFTVMDNRVKDITALFFPELRQEKFIALLVEHLKASGVDPSAIQFAKVTELKLLKEDDKKVEEGSADELVMRYTGSGFFKKPDEAAKAKERAETEKMMKSLKMQMVTLTFKGSYADLVTLIQKIEAYPRRITIEEVTSTQQMGSLVSTLKLGYYAIPKIHKDQDADFMAWTSTLPLGKKDPFAGISLSNIGTPSAPISATALENDFFLMLNPIASDLTTVVMSKMGDRSRVSYIYADNAGIEPITFEVVEKNGQYFYHYKTSASQYPQKYTEPVAFTPKSNTINLQIVSTKRIDDNDKSGVAFTVMNKTNLKLVITVKNDDARSRINWVKKEGDIQIQ